MENELALVLQKPIEELVPSMIAWNNEELLAKVEARLHHFKGIVYNETQIADAKQDRAQLNDFCKRLNDMRIQIGKTYNAPYDKFKSEVDEVINTVKSVVAEIDTQVKSYEAQKQEKKRSEIVDYFNSVIAEFAELIPYENIHNPKWLNSATSMKSIRADIDKIIEDARNAITAIEALHSEDEATVKAFYFRTLNLSAALTEDARLKEERKRFEELKTKKEQEKKQESKQEQQPQEQAAPTTSEKLYTVKFQVEGSVEQLKALQRFLIDNKIKFSQIKE